MKKSLYVFVLVMAMMVAGVVVCHAQQDPANVGTPAFKPLQSKSTNMTLKYGFLGVSVMTAPRRSGSFTR